MTGEATSQDRHYLDRAAALGRRGWGRVHPNPMVGCVLVRDGAVVAEGWHREWGGLHAEVEALQAAGDEARGSTAYVSLEPCRHVGKTPPCTRALVEAGVSRVVYGAADPGVGPGAGSGGGGRELARAGLEVVGPVFSPQEARSHNPAFFHEDGHRPWTALKLAVSLDGGIARAPGRTTAISGPESQERVHRLRAGFDAILVGANTARVDDPRLTVRGDVRPRMPPARVVVDGKATLRPDARMLREGEGAVHVMTLEGVSDATVRALEAAGATIHPLPGREGQPAAREGQPPTREGRVELEAAVRRLREVGLTSVLCEGGGVLGSALVSAGLVDRLILVVAPRLLGAGLVPGLHGIEEGRAGTWRLAREPERVGDDTWITLDREA
jgi:diaminohydroxyphosphoribosylaminopyrimidine deaminase / 5-amino-6-(5-phosphoribosylamino)uracil reductase